MDIGPEPFRASGARLVEPGWRYYYPYSKAEERILPELKEGERLRVLGHNVEAKETQPPARYGQGKLIKLMDELGLGTKSTRHDIISKLYARAYVQGNPMRPTNTAYAVVDTLQKYAPTITKPEMTQTLEKDMTQISEQKIKEDEVIEESRVMLTSVFDELSCNQEGIGQSLKDGLRTDKIVGTCEKCKSELIIRRGHRGSRFIGCSGYPECRFTLPLPRSGAVLVTDRVCEEHGMFHIRIINKGKRPWDLGCPHCNFLEWQARKARELAEGKETGEGKAAKPKPAKKTAKKAAGSKRCQEEASRPPMQERWARRTAGIRPQDPGEAGGGRDQDIPRPAERQREVSRCQDGTLREEDHRLEERSQSPELRRSSSFLHPFNLEKPPAVVVLWALCDSTCLIHCPMYSKIYLLAVSCFRSFSAPRLNLASYCSDYE